MEDEGHGGDKLLGVAAVDVEGVGIVLGELGRRGDRWRRRGLGLGVGGDASDVEEGGGSAAADFGFFGFVGEVDEAGGAVRSGPEGDELNLKTGDLGFELEELRGFRGVEGFVEVVEGTVELLEEVVEGDEGVLELVDEVFGVEFEVGGIGEPERLHDLLL